MSFIVKGIDLPKETERVEIICWRSIGENDEYIIQHNMDVETIQIPTPHGRLIDRDAMQGKAFEDYFKYQLGERDMYFVNKYIENAPTILEAED